MSLILKSNNATTGANLGNLNNINGASDWVLFYDFSGGNYSKRVSGVATKITQEQAISSGHDFALSDYPNPKTMNEFGTVRAVDSNNEVRKWLSDDGHYGVLSEGERSNLFLNPSTPTTQTISVTTSRRRFAAYCRGNGKMVISGSGLLNSPVTVNSTDDFKELLIPTGVATTLTITVSGTLTHAQVEFISEAFSVPTTPITSGTTRIADKITVNSSTLSQVVTDGLYTVVMQTVPIYMRKPPTGDVSVNPVETRLVASNALSDTIVALSRRYELSNGTKGVVFSNYNKDGTVVTNAGSPRLPASDRIENLAVAYDSTQFKVSMNDYPSIVKQATTNIGKPSTIQLAGLNPRISSMYGNVIITKLLVYNRVLSDSEMEDIVKNWV